MRFSLMLLLALLAGVAEGQIYPSRPIRLIVPFPPGGSNDIVARMVATQLGERLGQQVVIDNRGGAGGVLGSDLAAKSPPDGCTLLLISVAYAFGPALYKNLPYDPEKAFAPVGILGSGAAALTVHPSLPVNTVQELIALAKAKPGALLPDVPTISESGVSGYEAHNWWGVLAPAGTPAPVVEKLHKDLTSVLSSRETEKRFETEGAEVVRMTPAEFGRFISAELVKWSRVAREVGIKAE